MSSYKYDAEFDSRNLIKLSSLKSCSDWGIYMFACSYEVSTEEKCTVEIIKAFFCINENKIKKCFQNLNSVGLVNFYRITNNESKIIDEGWHFEDGLTPCDECKLYHCEEGCMNHEDTPFKVSCNESTGVLTLDYNV